MGWVGGGGDGLNVGKAVDFVEYKYLGEWFNRFVADKVVGVVGMGFLVVGSGWFGVVKLGLLEVWNGVGR